MDGQLITPIPARTVPRHLPGRRPVGREWPEVPAWIAEPEPMPPWPEAGQWGWEGSQAGRVGHTLWWWAEEAHTQPWLRFGARCIRHDPGRGRRLWRDGRPAAWLALRALIGSEGAPPSEGQGEAVPPRTCPALVRVRAEAASSDGKRMEVCVAGRRIRVPWPRQRKERPAGVDRKDWWVLVADRSPGTLALLRDAGFIELPGLGAYGATQDLAAACLAACTDEAGAAALAAGGIPTVLHPWLRHAPAMVPWGPRHWVLSGNRSPYTGFRPPGNGWRGRPDGQGWATRDGFAAYAMIHYAPRPLAEVFAAMKRDGVLSQIEPRRLTLVQPDLEGAGPSALAEVEIEAKTLVWCAECEKYCLRGALARDLGGAPCAWPHCTQGQAFPELPVRTMDDARALAAHRERADRAAWRRITDEMARRELEGQREQWRLDPAPLEEIRASVHHREGGRLSTVQEEAVAFHVAHPVAIDGNIMGTGKTITALTLCNLLWQRRPGGTYVFIVPAMARSNWVREQGQWLDPRIPFHLLEGGRAGIPPKGALVCSYETARDNPRLAAVRHRMIVCDECHMLKNPEARRSRAVLGGLRADRWVFMTGTLIYNRPPDAQPFLAKALPQACGDRAGFAKAYQIKDPTRLTGDEQSMLGQLRDLLADTILFRVSKERVLRDIPPKRPPALIEVPLGAKGQGLVDQEREKLAELRQSREQSMAIFAQIARLRMEIAELKVEAVVERMVALKAEDSAHLVFTWHVEIAERIAAQAGREGVDCAVLHGRRTDGQRRAAVREFQEEGRHDALISTMSAGGVAINLQRAEAVIFAELDWSPATMEQAEARAYRRGQRKSVRTFYMVGEGSEIDAHIAAMMMGKSEAASEIMGEQRPEHLVALMEAEEGRRAAGEGGG